MQTVFPEDVRPTSLPPSEDAHCAPPSPGLEFGGGGGHLPDLQVASLSTHAGSHLVYTAPTQALEGVWLLSNARF